VLDDGFYKLFVDLVALKHSSEKLDEPSSYQEAYEKQVWKDVMDIGSKLIMQSIIDSRLVVNGSIIEY
jgi:hypothetical protein